MKIFLAASQRRSEWPLSALLINELKSVGHDVAYRSHELTWEDEESENVTRAIRSADVVVGLLTETDGNVLYELGVAIGAGRPTLIATHGADTLPPDLRTMPFARLEGVHESDALRVVEMVQAMEPPTHRDPLQDLDVAGALELITHESSVSDALSPKEFESLVANWLRELGLLVDADGSRDQGYDMAIRVAGATYLVEVKLYRSQTLVSVSAVRQLLGTVVANEAAGGVLIATTGFTSAAQAFASETPVALRTVGELLQAQTRPELLLPT